MNAIASFSFEEQEVRFIGTADKSEWVGADVVAVLYPESQSKDRANYLAKVPSEWKGMKQIHTLGGKQNMITLYEPGLYHLIVRSESPIAVPFQKWVFEEVLPSIRKTGMYASHASEGTIDRRLAALESKIERLGDSLVPPIVASNAIAPESVDPFVLPSLPLTERVMLPKFPAVYFVVCAAKKEILYIGKAENLSTRWFNHELYKEFRALSNVRLAWLQVDDKNLLMRIEKSLINYFQPSSNRTLPPQTEQQKLALNRYTSAGLKKLSEIVRLARGAMSYRQFADVTNVSHSTLGRIEHSQVSRPEVSILARLAPFTPYTLPELIAVCQGKPAESVRVFRTAEEILPIVNQLPSSEALRLAQLIIGRSLETNI